ncbi:MAG: SANT/Myb-like DNA-binding domain-containing protein [archaeon]|nr:SANT/Myb-like DNA-binding domain-containing protein [archaeon]
MLDKSNMSYMTTSTQSLKNHSRPIKFKVTKEETNITPVYEKIKIIQPFTNHFLAFTPPSPKYGQGRWTREEQSRFVEAIMIYGNNWKKIQRHISTRSEKQARSHAQKFLLKLKNNPVIEEKGINLNLPWTQVIKILRQSFTLEEFKESQSRNVRKIKRKNVGIQSTDTTENLSRINEEDSQLLNEPNEFPLSEKEKMEEIYIENFIKNFDTKYEVDWEEEEGIFQAKSNTGSKGM